MATLDEIKARMIAKREQILRYYDGIDGDGPISNHARAVAAGRLGQLELDMMLLDEIETGPENSREEVSPMGHSPQRDCSTTHP